MSGWSRLGRRGWFIGRAGPLSQHWTSPLTFWNGFGGLLRLLNLFLVRNRLRSSLTLNRNIAAADPIA
jgi:hypothetical protein